MEKKAINFSLNTYITKFRRSHKESMDPNMLWRAMLWGGVVGVSLVAIFGYVTYDWALNVETPGQVTHNSRDALSLTELEDVIAIYHQKEVNFSTLLHTAPQAPNYQRSKGIVATTTPDMQINESTAAPQPTRTQ